MAFTNGDDINIIQSTDTAVISAGAGNDTYILSGQLIGANQSVTISDVEGSNKLQLVSGLTIVSSMLTSNAVQLTLNNGAKVTLLGADTFNYVVGGDALTGSGATVQNFNNFATATLGVTPPAVGAAPITNTVTQVISSAPPQIVIPIATTAGNSVGTTVGTSAADVFSFDVVAAKTQSNNTQVKLSDFAVGVDKLTLDLPIASGVTTLAALNGQQGVVAQADPFTGNMLVTFGADATGDVVSLTLVGITDSSLVNLIVV